jgi:PIN domain nuclease of toxin-antitoxin system
MFEHTAALSSLEFHHRDPFDRMIIAQALSEN